MLGTNFSGHGTDLQIPPKSALGNWPGVAGGEKGNSNVLPRSFPVSTGACYSPREGSTSQQGAFAHHLLWVCLPAIPLAGFIFLKRGHFLAKLRNSPEQHSSSLGLRNNRNFSRDPHVRPYVCKFPSGCPFSHVCLLLVVLPGLAHPPESLSLQPLCSSPLVAFSGPPLVGRE